jgi:hypothetical protein
LCQYVGAPSGASENSAQRKWMFLSIPLFDLTALFFLPLPSRSVFLVLYPMRGIYVYMKLRELLLF